MAKTFIIFISMGHLIASYNLLFAINPYFLLLHSRSTGFILEGFPRTPEECRYLAEAGLFPDAGVILTVEDTDVIARLLPPKLDKWKAKRDKRLERKRKKKEKAQKKRVSGLLALWRVLVIFNETYCEVFFFNVGHVLSCSPWEKQFTNLESQQNVNLLNQVSTNMSIIFKPRNFMPTK